MSHSKERGEKNCLNCGAAVLGRYCQSCGQENTEPKETVWTLVSHFFNDITHFDGKFFSTGKYLLTKPGFLSVEYLKGRRASYLHPIRMYVFTAAFFFIIFFSLFNPEHIIKSYKNNEEQLKELSEASSSLKEKSKDSVADPVEYAARQRAIVKIDRHAKILEQAIEAEQNKATLARLRKGAANPELNIDSLAGRKIAEGLLKADSVKKRKRGSATGDIDFGSSKFDYRSQLAYDSVQKELPAENKAGWWERAVATKVILLNSKFKDDKKEGLALFLEKFMHTLPQALFVSLPFFALILLMLYARRNFYYVDHGIFTIHLYCASFILLLFMFAFEKISDVTGIAWIKSLDILFMLGIFFYLYKAMRRFYRQGRGKTILKLIVLNILAFIVMMTIAGLFFTLSLVQFA